MTAGRTLYLFDDGQARRWHPFAATRPVGELLFGTLLLRERIERGVGLPAAATLGCPGLEGFSEPGAPPVWNGLFRSGGGESLILLSRYVPPLTQGLSLPSAAPPGGLRLVCGGTPVGWLLPGGTPLPSAEELAAPHEGGDDREELRVPGEVLDRPWNLMERNGERVAADLAALYPGGRGGAAAPFDPPRGVWVTGGHPVSAAPDVQVAPGVVLDTRDGPIHLSAGVRIEPRTHLQGPAWIGEGCHLLGGRLGQVSVGPVSKVHGEVDSTVLNGFVNKAHDGHLGHAVVGRWVNLGAMTTNSDLKNTYGPIRVKTPEDPGGAAGEPVDVDTGMIKVGAFLGDYVRTGIGTLLNSGVVVGAGSTLFAGPVISGWVPPFSWVTPEGRQGVRLDAFLTVTTRAMGRRGRALDAGTRELLTRLHREAGGGSPDRDEGKGVDPSTPAAGRTESGTEGELQ